MSSTTLTNSATKAIASISLEVAVAAAALLLQVALIRMYPEIGAAIFAILVVTGVVLWVWPELALAVFIGGYWLLRTILHAIAPDISVVAIQLLLLLSAMAILPIRRPLKGRILDPFVVASGLLAVWMFATLSWSPSEGYGATKVYLFLIFNVLGLIGARAFIADPKSIDRLSWAVAFVGVAQLIISVPELTTAGSLDRLSLLGENPIFLARDLGITALLALYLVLKRSRLSGLLLLLIVTNSVLIVLSGSRMPLVAFVLVAAGMFAVARRLGARRIVVLMATGLLIAVTPGVTGLSFGATTERFLAPEPETDRYPRYRLALDHVGDSLVAGSGSGAYASIAGPGDAGEERNYPHNIFLEVLLEFGLIGLTLLIGGLIFLSRKIYLMYKTSEPGSRLHLDVAVACCAFAFLNAQVSGDIYANSSFWVFAGIVLGISDPPRRVAVSPTPRRTLQHQGT
jgi:O-antigen ligase